MRRAALAAAFAWAVSACAHIEVDKRVERGPSLRTFDRELVAEGGLAGQVEAKWPQLTVQVSAYDLCRIHKVEEYVEETITERTATSSGPALTLGVTTTLVGAGLYLARPLFPGAPNSQVIDQAGNYGPSQRQVFTGWSVGFLVVGIPALVVGVLGYSQAGDDVQTRKVEQVVSATEQRCHLRAVDGKLELGDSAGAPGLARQTRAGQAAFEADELRAHPVDRLLFNGRAVEVPAGGMALVDAFRTCAELGAAPALEALSRVDLSARLARARQCRTVEGGPGAEAVSALNAEVARRGESEVPLAERPGPRLEGYEDALAAYAPRLHFAAGSADLPALAQPDALVGQSATLAGILEERPEANIAVVQLGAQRVLLFVPADVPWAFDFAVGTRVEVLAVAMGHQALGPLAAPLFRAVWMRPSP